MPKHKHFLASLKKLMRRSKRRVGSVVALGLMFVGAVLVYQQTTLQPRVTDSSDPSSLSSEYAFFNTSPAGPSGGLAVPASCPSDLHDEPGYGGSCGPFFNSCNQSSGTGTIQCGGGCNVSAPPESGCCIYDDAWCQGIGWDYSTDTCLGYCGCNAGTSYVDNSPPIGDGRGGSCQCTAGSLGFTAGTASCATYAGSYGIPATHTEGTANYTVDNCTSEIVYTGGCSEPLVCPGSDVCQASTCAGHFCMGSPGCWYPGTDPCLPNPPGVCSGTHYGCDVGSSINAAQDASNWYWQCQNTGGTVSCQEAKPVCVGNVGDFCYSYYGCSSGTIQCDGSCDAGSDPVGTGNVCGNSCFSGTIQCNGLCDAANAPANLGNNCESVANSCGMKGSGTIQCNGTCNATVPSNTLCTTCPNGTCGAGESCFNCPDDCPSSPQTGSVCTSGQNSCSMTNNGNYLCNGVCNATTPSDALCPPTHNITASATNCSISPSGTTSVSDGGSQSYSISPNINHVISDVTVDGSSIGATTGHTFSNVRGDHSIHATCTSTSTTVNGDCGTAAETCDAGNYSNSPADTGTDYRWTCLGTGTPRGTDSGICTAPIATTVNGWCSVIAETCAAGSYSNLPADTALNYQWTCLGTGSPRGTDSGTCSVPKAATFRVTASAGPGGSIAPSGTETGIPYNASRSFSITPDAGKEIVDVTANGVSYGPTTSVTIFVTRDYDVVASFGDPPPPPPGPWVDVVLNGCPIPAGASTCMAPIYWKFHNTSAQQVRRNGSRYSFLEQSAPGAMVTLRQGVNTLSFYDESIFMMPVLLDWGQVSGTCEVGTTWNIPLNQCVAVVPRVVELTLTPNPANSLQNYRLFVSGENSESCLIENDDAADGTWHTNGCYLLNAAGAYTSPNIVATQESPYNFSIGLNRYRATCYTGPGACSGTASAPLTVDFRINSPAALYICPTSSTLIRGSGTQQFRSWHSAAGVTFDGCSGSSPRTERTGTTTWGSTNNANVTITNAGVASAPLSAATGNPAASITATWSGIVATPVPVIVTDPPCTPRNCNDYPTQQAETCSSSLFYASDGCGGSIPGGCPGTLSCDYNWKEVGQ